VLLAEVEDPIGRVQPLLGTNQLGPLMWDDPITEKPKLNTTERWMVINATPDTHPVHLHLVQFQVINRESFDTALYIPGMPGTLHLSGVPEPPALNERGWKDTVQAPKGMVTRVIAKFDLTGMYVWHCHILEHEDHEMMRPMQVVP
jgi:spore coat protein A